MKYIINLTATVNGREIVGFINTDGNVESDIAHENDGEQSRPMLFNTPQEGWNFIKKIFPPADPLDLHSDDVRYCKVVPHAEQ